MGPEVPLRLFLDWPQNGRKSSAASPDVRHLGRELKGFDDMLRL